MAPPWARLIICIISGSAELGKEQVDWHWVSQCNEGCSTNLLHALHHNVRQWAVCSKRSPWISEDTRTFEFRRLQILNASRNMLTFVKLVNPSLTEINLSHNELIKLPDFSALTQLSKLLLSHNDIDDMLLDCLGRWGNLKTISIACSGVVCVGYVRLVAVTHSKSCNSPT